MSDLRYTDPRRNDQSRRYDVQGSDGGSSHEVSVRTFPTYPSHSPATVA
jgi:hypothetical protein